MLANNLAFFLVLLVDFVLFKGLGHGFFFEGYLELYFLLHLFETTRQYVQLRFDQIVSLLDEDLLKIFLRLQKYVGVLSSFSSETLQQTYKFLFHTTILKFLLSLLFPVTGVEGITVNRKLDHYCLKNKQVVVQNVVNVLLNWRVQFIHFSQLFILLNGPIQQ
jgi:hypothetical protein